MMRPTRTRASMTRATLIRRLGQVLCLCLPIVALGSAAAAKRVLEVEDFDRLVSVEDLVCSQDGRWIAYTVDGTDLQADERVSVLWMVNYEGTQHVRLTAPGETVSDPKFSPDGRYVSFLSARGTDDRKQLYLLCLLYTSPSPRDA